ncbi:MAG TPA: MFS transporter [Stellaceae bacterium]|nr:MFS transporter [Stellaceae bacterium]
MTRQELRATGALAAVFAMRLLGLFMIYPIFAASARHLRGATPETIGLALGAYGLTQGLLQIPFGLLSDRIGRKLVIAGGLVLFGIGSAVAALSSSIEGVMLGRILQGMGAVGSVVLALVADLTRDEVRTRAMALVGVTIGLSFVVAIAVGPLLAAAIGLSGIFWLTAALALLGIAVTLFLVPTPPRLLRHRDAEAVPALLVRVLRDPELLRLDFAIFALHAILTASFLAVPALLVGALHLAAPADWKLYLPVLAASVVLMAPVVLLAEKSARMKEIFLLTIAVLAGSLLMLALGGTSAGVVVAALVLFFAAFNTMEAVLPSLITKTAPAGAKGTATGIYSSAQFLGIFFGGAVGGWASAAGGAGAVFGFTLAVALAWLALAMTMRRPGRYKSCVAPLCGDADERLVALLQGAPGVVEAALAPEEGVAYLKIEPSRFDAAAVARITGAAIPDTAGTGRVQPA